MTELPQITADDRDTLRQTAAEQLFDIDDSDRDEVRQMSETSAELAAYRTALSMLAPVLDVPPQAVADLALSRIATDGREGAEKLIADANGEDLDDDGTYAGGVQTTEQAGDSDEEVEHPQRTNGGARHRIPRWGGGSDRTDSTPPTHDPRDARGENTASSTAGRSVEAAGRVFDEEGAELARLVPGAGGYAARNGTTETGLSSDEETDE